ncbi:hypothetical protein [Amycolatopsis kentuckyensis]|uniref:hypothetical protein n=1 Tax=Amycolatopsis kentuckyensis TaxID=218823 RepID=UPI0035668813
MSAWADMKANLEASAAVYDTLAGNLETLHSQAEGGQLLWSRITPTASNVKEVSEAAGWVLETNEAIMTVARGCKQTAAAIRAASASYP